MITPNGIVGEGAADSNEEPLDIRLETVLESAISALEDRIWLMARWPPSMLAFLTATMLFADWPRP